MKKTPSLFLRDPEDMRHLLQQVNPDCRWVIDGEGTATRKYDGTCVLLDEHGAWWARREVKPEKAEPPNWVELDADPVTGKRMGWEPIEQSGFRKAHAEALAHWDTLAARQPGTYELCGPKIGGNPEGYPQHVLVPHADAQIIPMPDLAHLDDQEAYAVVEQILLTIGVPGWEGVVWHHPDGRLAKIKVRDFRR